ncbi:MAG: hypothetical protein CMM56_06940 [Rhodospirillaceae bacterium]|nr:hypothetical protein [Rhodospirillaceae bacterium]|tara:strand:+ start:1203 stop:1979 length:777 start_codon:yes stop_codon:yes gene_type:complete
MISFYFYLYALATSISLAILVWGLSLWLRDVSIVDSIWSLMIAVCTIPYLILAPEVGIRGYLITCLVWVWALRLSGYITWRNWGIEEDHRYKEIRKNNEPNFEVKSLYIIFVFQAFCASIISLSLLPSIAEKFANGWFDYIGLFLFIVGFLFESISDYQLCIFKSNPVNKVRVFDKGLWRYTRHPNYFGDFCVWWGFFFFSLGSDSWWTIISPLLMSFFLLKFSGVAVLEKTIKTRRPAYTEYVKYTNTFFPGPRKKL